MSNAVVNPLFFRDRRLRAGAERQVQSKTEQTWALAPGLVCAACRNPITQESAAIEVAGGHVHRRANPLGIEYEFACFAVAEGCQAVGPASAEHTWFAGFVWQLGLCSACRTHLGWRFLHSDGGQDFYALILDRLLRLGE